MRILILLISLLVFSSGARLQASLHGIIASFATLYASTACHEMGHALAGKIFFGDPIDIEIGLGLTAQIIDNPSVKIKVGILPGGQAHYAGNEILHAKTDKLKRLAVVLAGPLSAITSCLLINTLINTICGDSNQFLNSLSKKLKIMALIESLNFLPISLMGTQTDGLKAKKLINALINNASIDI